MKVPTIFDIILMEATKKTKDGLLVDLDADEVENDTDYTQDVDVEDDEIDLGASNIICDSMYCYRICVGDDKLDSG